MKATVNPLFDTLREIISFDDSEFDRPSTIAQLRECDNVIVGNRIDGSRSPYEVLIEEGDNARYIYVMPLTIHHPADGSRMNILEVN